LIRDLIKILIKELIKALIERLFVKEIKIEIKKILERQVEIVMLVERKSTRLMRVGYGITFGCTPCFFLAVEIPHHFVIENNIGV
jgi:hypothetical protein